MTSSPALSSSLAAVTAKYSPQDMLEMRAILLDEISTGVCAEIKESKLPRLEALAASHIALRIETDRLKAYSGVQDAKLAARERDVQRLTNEIQLYQRMGQTNVEWIRRLQEERLAKDARLRILEHTLEQVTQTVTTATATSSSTDPPDDGLITLSQCSFAVSDIESSTPSPSPPLAVLGKRGRKSTELDGLLCYTHTLHAMDARHSSRR